MAVTRSSFGGVAIRYVLPVLWVTSRLAVMGRMAMRGRLNLNLLPLAVLRYQIPGQSLLSMNALLIFDIWVLWRSGLSVRAPECQKFKMVGLTSMAKCKALTGSAVKGLTRR